MTFDEIKKTTHEVFDNHPEEERWKREIADLPKPKMTLDQLRALQEAAQRGPPRQHDQAQLGARQDPAIAAITLEQMQDAYRERQSGAYHPNFESPRQDLHGRDPRRLVARIRQIRKELEAAGRLPKTCRAPTFPPIVLKSRRHPIRFLLRLPGRFWRALTWGSRNGYQRPKRMSHRAWREWENTWGPRDGNWDRWGRERRVYA